MWRRLSYWLDRDRKASQLREEMEAHLEMMVESLREQGLSEDEARDAARRQFGSLTRQQERARETWIARRLTEFAQDLRFATRTIRKEPGSATVAILSAALGIGSCSLIFGIANTALFRRLPVSEPAQLVEISGKNLRRGKVGQSVSYPDYEDLRRGRSFEGVTAFAPFIPAVISTGGTPQRYWGSLVTADYFDVVRPSFAAGRGFDADSGAPAVVISHRLWRSRFGEDPGIVGRTIEVNRRKVVVSGVTTANFHGTEMIFSSDFWAPFTMADTLGDAEMNGKRRFERGGQWLNLAGRLRRGVDEASARAEVGAIAARLTRDFPATNRDRGFHLERAGQLNPGIRKMAIGFFAMLMAVALLVLVAACANVANLLLARAAARQREIATRLALGAGRTRLVRQLLTESGLLAVAGGAGGYLLAAFGARALSSASLPLSVPVELSYAFDYRVLLFCAVLSTVTGVIFGLAPALRATSPNLTSGLKNEPVQFGRSRRFGLRNALMAGQVAICMVLLICSGLFLRSFSKAARLDTGMANRNILLAGFDPGLNGHDAVEARRLLQASLTRAEAIPGVDAVTITSSVPLSAGGTQNAFTPEERIGEGASGSMTADIYLVGPRFFETFGIPLLAGDDFRPGAPAADIAIVNQALAEKAFAGQNPVGRRILYQGRRVTVIGLAATAKSRTVGEDPRPCLYFPVAKDAGGGDAITGVTMALRTRGDPSGYVQQVHQAIRETDAGLAVFQVRTWDAHLSQALFLPRVSAFLFGFAGAMGLLIASIGLYGVMSFSAARRTKEIGIRMALGARRGQVVGTVLREGVALTAVGSVVGLAAALALSRVAASLLYGVSPRDGVTFVAVPLFLGSVAALACWIPARRAASVDPILALRQE
jgi:predicted permease